MATTETTKWDLEFAPCKMPQLIPRVLIESVKGLNFSPEDFYSYQTRNLNNPNNFIFYLINPAMRVHGFLWAERNMLDDSLFVNTFSVSKEYWGKGEAIPHVIEFLRDLCQKVQIKRTYWITTNEKFFVKKGFKRSKNTLMEYNFDRVRECDGTD